MQPQVGLRVPEAAHDREPAGVEVPEVVLHAGLVHVGPAGIARRAEEERDAGESPAPGVVAHEAPVVLAERLAEQLLVQVGARQRAAALEVVGRHLREPFRHQVVPPDAVHLQVLLRRGQLAAAVAREVGAPGDVQLVVGEMSEAGVDERLQVAPHVVDRLVRPAEDQIDAHRQAQRPARVERAKDLFGGLPASAGPDQLVVELLRAHADAVDAAVAHGGQLLVAEGLRNALQGHLDAGRNVEDAADDVHQRPVLVRPVEVGRAAAEVDAGHLGAFEVRPEQLPFAPQVAEIGVELPPVPVDLGGEETEPATPRIGRQAVRRADVQVDPLADARGRRPVAPHDGRHRDVAVEPEDGRRMPVQHLVALPALPVPVDVGANLAYVTHDGCVAGSVGRRRGTIIVPHRAGRPVPAARRGAAPRRSLPASSAAARLVRRPGGQRMRARTPCR